VGNFTHILWREQVAYHEEIRMKMITLRSLVEHLDKDTAGRWFSPGTLGTKNKTDRREISEILLKVVLNAIAMIL
jgi:hypothetical protein